MVVLLWLFLLRLFCCNCGRQSIGFSSNGE